MEKNLVIAGLSLVSIGLAIELRNLREDFITLLTRAKEIDARVNAYEAIVVDTIFTDMVNNIE